MAASWPRPLGLLLILGSLAYANVLGLGLVWDDTHFLREGAAVTRAPWSVLLGSDFWLEGERSGYYRPLVTASYAVEWRLFGPAPAGYHAMNLLYHLAACALLVWVAVPVLGNNAGAWLAGAVFAVHPIHTESVAFVSGRTDVMATALFLLAFGAHLRSGQGPRWRVLSAAAFGLALTAKETAIALPAVIVAWELGAPQRSGERRSVREIVTTLLPYAAVAAGYLVLRSLALGGVGGHPVVWGSMPSRLLLGLAVIGRSLLLLLAPYPPNPHHVLGQWRALDLAVPAGALVAGSAAILWSWRRSAVPAFAGAWFLLTLLPTTPLVPLIPAQMAERFLYLPSAGFALAAGWAVHGALRQARTARIRLAATALSAVALAGAVGLSLHRNEDWRSAERLFTRMADVSPASWIAPVNLGYVRLERDELDSAGAEFRRALALRPDYAGALVGLAIVESRRGRHAEAIWAGERAQALAPGDEVIDLQLGAVYGNAGDHARAAERFAEAARKNPGALEARYKLALALALGGRGPEARAALAEADRLADAAGGRATLREAALARHHVTGGGPR